MKVFNGRIKDWEIKKRKDGYYVTGHFLDHPMIRGWGYTSKISKIDFETGDLETLSSTYKLVEDGEESRFMDFPMKGDKMVFLNENGYDAERKNAAKVFSKDVDYTVKKCEVGDWNHFIEFEEVPGNWNGVMFKRVS